MIFRRANSSPADLDARDRRRRGRRPADEDVPTYAVDDEQSGAGADETGAGRGASGDGSAPRTQGPYDAADVDSLDEPLEVGRIDLGGLQVHPVEGLELRLQVDEESQTVVAALFVQEDSALELRPFAAPRTEGLWGEIRREIAAETTRRGGMVTEGTGPFGPEVKVVVPATMPDGQQATQASRIIGVDGPRWFLRGTLIGRAAVEPDAAEPLLAAMAQVVVVRGKGPMAPRDMIPLRLPEEAQQIGPEDVDDPGDLV
ncbi:DUF3710 domain-containing protein [Actinopolymorpha cephalotaxi]|uniref:DUF3710 domain-containing protein n=1 Tax=Actinopolymorpha cephalotaxi TaxID=504797 RepID=A0ABX2S1T4_9ACTN|nr:DUF3710 domain-containing protein [Actinopolymorpha cephalotaxi]NYH83570.1 hypothetical protein [Actinopolymorpha cephalotaxi]